MRIEKNRLLCALAAGFVAMSCSAGGSKGHAGAGVGSATGGSGTGANGGSDASSGASNGNGLALGGASSGGGSAASCMGMSAPGCGDGIL